MSMETRPGTVFVSSTCYDLIDLRAEVCARLLAAHLRPIMSDQPATEFETPGTQNSIQTCLDNIQTCQSFVMILSQRYGPRLKHFGFDDVSATHLEYRLAISLRMPILVYIRDRLMAEYVSWKKHGSSYRKNWIQKDEDAGLFELIDEHKRLGRDRPNWISPFANSIELCDRLMRDLKAKSNAAALEMLAGSGQIPSLSIAMGSGTIQQREIRILNGSSRSALGCILSMGRSSYAVDVGDIPGNQTKTSYVNLLKMYNGVDMNDRVAVKPGALWGEITYSTSEGHRIQDTLAVDLVDGSPRTIKIVGRAYLGLDRLPLPPATREFQGLMYIDSPSTS